MIYLMKELTIFSQFFLLHIKGQSMHNSTLRGLYVQIQTHGEVYMCYLVQHAP